MGTPAGTPELEKWSGRLDSNQRPPAPKAGALPGCATPRLSGRTNHYPTDPPRSDGKAGSQKRGQFLVLPTIAPVRRRVHIDDVRNSAIVLHDIECAEVQIEGGEKSRESV